MSHLEPQAWTHTGSFPAPSLAPPEMESGPWAVGDSVAQGHTCDIVTHRCCRSEGHGEALGKDKGKNTSNVPNFQMGKLRHRANLQRHGLMTCRHAFSQAEGQGIPQAMSYLPRGCVAPSGPVLEDWTSCFMQPTSSFSLQMRKNVLDTPVQSPPPAASPGF